MQHEQRAGLRLTGGALMLKPMLLLLVVLGVAALAGWLLFDRVLFPYGHESGRHVTFASDHSYGKRYASRGGRYGGYSPVLDPERQIIFFGCPTAGPLGEICTIGVDGQQLMSLTQTDYYVGDSSLSFDGEKLAFVAEPDHSAPAIHMMDLNTRQITPITRPAYRDRSPVFSPDGQWLAFTRHMSSDADAMWSEELFIIRVDGTGERRLTANTVSESPVAFSGDKRHLYFIGVDADLLSREHRVSYDLYRIDIESGDVELLLPLKLRGGPVAMSQDGKYLAYVDDKDEPFAYEVFLHDLETSEVTQLTHVGGFIQSVSFARGRNDLLTCAVEPKGGHKKSIADILVIEASEPKVTRINWSRLQVGN
jgi:dipeptidyl aminopeptidase/acylaminoacyl peptidase